MLINFSMSMFKGRILWYFEGDMDIRRFGHVADEFTYRDDYSGFDFMIGPYRFDIDLAQPHITLRIYHDDILISKHSDCRAFDFSITENRVKVQADWKHEMCFWYER